jgi:hypothetical protein
MSPLVVVTPAKAGIHEALQRLRRRLDSGVRRNDNSGSNDPSGVESTHG